MTMRRIVVVIARVNRMIVTKGDAFEIVWRTANRLGLTKRNIVRRLAFEYEIGRLI